MKTNLSIITKGLFILLLYSFQTVAQEQKMHVKLLADSNYIRAFETSLQPGEKTDLHSHSAHFYYALTDGKLIVHFNDGKDEIYELKEGDSGVSDPERPHVSENGGSTPLKFLVVELKEHPYVAPKKK